jgi:hypothetical protein
MNKIYDAIEFVLGLWVMFWWWVCGKPTVPDAEKDGENLTEDYLDDGYPTDKALKKIRDWEIKTNDELFNLLDFVRTLWHWSDLFTKKDNGAYILITGGWSGNEQLIRAMHENYIFWAFMWYSSTCGGYHVFAPHNVEPEDDVEPGIYKQWLEKFNRVFGEIPEPSTQEEIKEYLLEAGYNIDELNAEGEAFIKNIIEKDGQQ